MVKPADEPTLTAVCWPRLDCSSDCFEILLPLHSLRAGAGVGVAARSTAAAAVAAAAAAATAPAAAAAVAAQTVTDVIGLLFFM